MDFIAQLKYRTHEDGGRKTPACSGYKPRLKFAFTDVQTFGLQTFIDKDWVYPGEEVTAKIKISDPELFAGQLYPGIEFELRESARIIATGVILMIVNSMLNKTNAYH